MSARLTNKEFFGFAEQLSNVQTALLTMLRELIVKNDPIVSERIEKGKWLKGYLKYYSPANNFIYALGPKVGNKISLHLMPYYGSIKLQEKYGTELKPFLTGKSCLDFKTIEQVPQEILAKIITGGSRHLDDTVANLTK